MLYDFHAERRAQMRTVPQAFSALIGTDAPGGTNRVGHHVQGLMRGALLAPGTRTVTAALRGMGLAHATSFQQ
jgi:hypothetical protein